MSQHISRTPQNRPAPFPGKASTASRAAHGTDTTRGRGSGVGVSGASVPGWVLAVLGGAPVLAVLLAVLLSATPGHAATYTSTSSAGVSVPGRAAGDVSCTDQKDASGCDADGNAIPDAVEVVVCGSGTCATGREDTDRDGIPDWTEIMACGDVTCADPAADADNDGVPDYAETLACGSATCSNGRDDTDGNGVADWIDYVICGSAGCATGKEDFDQNGVSDAAELAACVKDQPSIFGIQVPGTGPGSGGFLASTGFQVLAYIVAAALLLGSGAFLYFSKKKSPAPGTDADGPGQGGNDDDDDDVAGEVRYWV